MQCLDSIADEYYEHLPDYMEAIWSLTVRAVEEDKDEVALQALGLWTTISDIERDLLEDPAHNLRFLEKAAQALVPLILNQLTKQEEGQEQDEGSWNTSQAAALILDNTAAVLGDVIVSLVVPFVQTNIARNRTEDDWRAREAAITALGYILCGPSQEKLEPLIQEGLPFIMELMKSDPHPMVRHTATWVLGRIFEFAHIPAVLEHRLDKIVPALLDALSREDHFSRVASYCLISLAEGFMREDANPFLQYIHPVLTVGA